MNLHESKLLGGIYGGIIGDIFGLKYEGIKPKHINKDNILKKTLYNNYSDDTEHLLIMIHSLNSNSIDEFNKSFIKNLKIWFFTFPFGIGKSTLKSIIKSFFTKKSGVKSTGNGAIMRTGIIGLLKDKNEIEDYINSNVKLTHNSDEAIITSLIFAKATNYLLNNSFNIDEFISLINIENEKWNNCLIDIRKGLINNLDPIELSKNWTKDKGAYGYTIITCALSIYTFLFYKDDFKSGLKSIISCGGDTDTNGFVYGMISGVYSGLHKLNKEEVNIINKTIDMDTLKDSLLKNTRYKIDFKKMLFKHIIAIPLIFLELLKRYLYIILNKKI